MSWIKDRLDARTDARLAASDSRTSWMIRRKRLRSRFFDRWLHYAVYWRGKRYE